MMHGRAAPPPRRDPEATKKVVGGVLWLLGMLGGALLLLLVFLLPALFAGGPALRAMGVASLFALVPLVVYLWVPWIVDRYDPEPWWTLALCLAWGAVAACGFSALLNTMVQTVAYAATRDEGVAEAIGACLSAPFVEELFKGMAVFGMFYFLRREFDGLVDGVMYAAFAALGFAAIENVVYYSNAIKAQALGGTFFVRGVLAPWGHPLYTAMTGLGFGFARETDKPWVRWLAPLGGLSAAMFLHFVWNAAATLSGNLVVLMLPLWFCFVLGFGGLVLWLVARKGRIIKDHLKDEVLMGHLTPWELELVGSPIAHLRATTSFGGAAGRKFIDAAARLGLSKWHTARAWRGRKGTISADMIYPLRQDLARLRHDVARSMGRPVPQPEAWQPGRPMPPAQHFAPR